MMRKHKLQAVALLAAMLTQTSLVCAVDAAEADGVAACASEQDDARRLECYDRAARKKKESAIEVSPARTDAETPAPPERAPTPAPVAQPDEFGITGSAVARQRYGEREQERKQAKEVRSISAQVTEVASRPRGELVVTLDNGQVWVQKESGQPLPIRVGDRVTINAGMLGSYRLVNGNRATQVTRVK
jgi:uncharacterized cupin superfamily protein